ncbi:MAG TPA: hypothetical protein VGM39_13330 [Kofleriaceae bacterium]
MVLVAVFLVGACKDEPAKPPVQSKPQAPAPTVADVLVEVTALEQQMCACTAKDCVEHASAAYEAWKLAIDQRIGSGAFHPDDAMLAKMMEAGDKIDICKQKVSGEPEHEKPYAATDSADATAALVEMIRFADAMCSCKDTRCSSNVSAEYRTWSSDPHVAQLAYTEASTVQLTVALRRFSTCAATAEGTQ